MAYKKYIMRNGKLYGPYLYESRRVNGKVVSEYHGANKKKFGLKKFMFVLLGVFLLTGFAYGIISFQSRITSNVVFDMKADYKQGEIMNGFFKISLNSGEFIPADSKIIFENNGNNYEYSLKEAVSEQPIIGDFYLSENDISGEGEGYGNPGKIIINPAVSFTMKIYSDEPEASSQEEIVEESPAVETPIENTTDNTENPETGEVIQEQPVAEETPSGIPIETQTPAEEIPAEIHSEEIEEEEVQENSGTEEDIENIQAPITGGAVSNFFGKFFNFFQGMITGKATSNFNFISEVNGEVSKDKPFTYDLEEGQTAEIISSYKDVHLTIKDNKAIVTTDYSEEQSGFGQEYKDGDKKMLDIDLSKLNLNFDKGELKTKIVYGDEEIFSSNVVLDEGNVEIQKKIQENFVIGYSETLSDKEKQILEDNFGNFSMKRTAKKFNGRIIVRYELEDKWVEYSYEEMAESELEITTEKDRIKWLKDIAIQLSSSESSEEEIVELEKSY